MRLLVNIGAKNNWSALHKLTSFKIQLGVVLNGHPFFLLYQIN